MSDVRPSYHGRRFRAVSLDESSDVGDETIFYYEQNDDRLTATYSGGDIDWGSMVGTVRADGSLTFLYQHRTLSGDLKSGRCESRPEIRPGGKLRLHERWQWHGGPSGESVVEEI